MPRPPNLPPDRFFARVDRFVCECPFCGVIIHANFAEKLSRIQQQQVQRQRTKRALELGRSPDRGRALQFNPLTSRLCCPSCRKVWAVGLVLYPVAGQKAGRQPEDQRPTWQQLLELRQLAGGVLGDGVISGEEPVNLAVESACTCEVDRAGCPVHR